MTNETLGRSKKKDELSSFFSAPDFIEWNYKTAAKYFTSNRLVINDNNPNVMVNYKGTGSAYYKLIKDATSNGRTVKRQFHVARENPAPVCISIA